MLYIVLVLVLAALGLLVTALITASSLWAWVSIGLSVLAGLILVADWLRRRRRAAAPAAPPASAPAASEPASASDSAEPVEPVAEEQTTLIPAAGDLGDPADTPEPEPADEPDVSAETETNPDAEPGVEETPEADAAILADLDDEVVVVDEHPRYHLRTCPWLGPRDTIPIGVGEARQLGFTPCATCTPDNTLVTPHR